MGQLVQECDLWGEDGAGCGGRALVQRTAPAAKVSSSSCSSESRKATAQLAPLRLHRKSGWGVTCLSEKQSQQKRLDALSGWDLCVWPKCSQCDVWRLGMRPYKLSTHPINTPLLYFCLYFSLLLCVSSTSAAPANHQPRRCLNSSAAQPI